VVGLVGVSPNFWENRDFLEIASQLQTSLANVRTIFDRATEEVRKQIAP